MTKSPINNGGTLSALLVACAVAAFSAQPAAAQTAKKLKCTGCVKSKQIKDGAIKGTDIRNNAISGAKIETNAVTTGKIADGAVELGKLSAAVQNQLNASGTGDITGVTAGTGLSGGGTTGEVTLNVDFDSNGTAATAARSDHTHDGTTIDSDSITADHLAADSVGATALGNDSVGTNELQSGAVNFIDLNGNAKGVGAGGALVIPAAAFMIQNDLDEFQVNFSGYIRPRLANDTICIWAPAQLPNGVTVTRFDIVAADNSVPTDVEMDLIRGGIGGTGIGNFEIMASADSSGAALPVRTFLTTDISSAVVDAVNNQYFIAGCWSSDVSATNTRLYAARIVYN